MASKDNPDPRPAHRLVAAWREHDSLPFPKAPKTEVDLFALLVLQDTYLAGHAYSVLGLSVTRDARTDPWNERRISALLAGQESLRHPSVPTRNIRWYSALDTAWHVPARSPSEEAKRRALRHYRDVLRELAEALAEALVLPLAEGTSSP